MLYLYYSSSLLLCIPRNRCLKGSESKHRFLNTVVTWCVELVLPSECDFLRSRLTYCTRGNLFKPLTRKEEELGFPDIIFCPRVLRGRIQKCEARNCRVRATEHLFLIPELIHSTTRPPRYELNPIVELQKLSWPEGISGIYTVAPF